jgi:hypothetical protein
MALTKAGLKAVIITKLNAQFGAPSDSSVQDKFADAVADAVVSYLVTNTVVAVTSVSGVTTGPGVSGPGAGTIS